MTGARTPLAGRAVATIFAVIAGKIVARVARCAIGAIGVDVRLDAGAAVLRAAREGKLEAAEPNEQQS